MAGLDSYFVPKIIDISHFFRRILVKIAQLVIITLTPVVKCPIFTVNDCCCYGTFMKGTKNQRKKKNIYDTAGISFKCCKYLSMYIHR
jgi:hypothetical protein